MFDEQYEDFDDDYPYAGFYMYSIEDVFDDFDDDEVEE